MADEDRTPELQAEILAEWDEYYRAETTVRRSHSRSVTWNGVSGWTAVVKRNDKQVWVGKYDDPHNATIAAEAACAAAIEVALNSECPKPARAWYTMGKAV